jgi:type IV pilus assembly protein PilV
MSTQRGFSLIEALIALVVLSIGLIGVAAMQLKALQSATAGYQRSVASVAAVDAQERLWAQLATLEPGQTCAAMNTTVVESEWRNHWFQNNRYSPLRGASSAQSVIEQSGDDDSCRFDIAIVLSDDNNDRLGYTFRLPSMESTP